MDRAGRDTAAVLETTLGRYDDALGRLSEMRDLAQRSGIRLDRRQVPGGSRGPWRVMRGRPEQARELLEEALGVSLAARITRGVTLCLAALARRALVEDDPERAVLVAGAAEGLRGRAGLRTWPILRQGEAELVAQVRQALGDDRFGQAFAAGSRLSQQEAVAAIRDRPRNRTQPS